MTINVTVFHMAVTRTASPPFAHHARIGGATGCAKRHFGRLSGPRGPKPPASLTRAQRRQKVLNILRQRRLEPHPFTAYRMHESQRRRMQRLTRKRR